MNKFLIIFLFVFTSCFSDNIDDLKESIINLNKLNESYLYVNKYLAEDIIRNGTLSPSIAKKAMIDLEKIDPSLSSKSVQTDIYKKKPKHSTVGYTYDNALAIGGQNYNASSIFDLPINAARSYRGNIALVIGNQDYISSSKLDTPINNARSIANQLRLIGYHVAKKENIRTHKEFLEILQKFAIQSRSADIALIYYAGHSIEAWGKFYLLPTNSGAINSSQDLTSLVNYNDLETAVRGARLTGILSLDACRRNPLDNLHKQSNSRSIFHVKRYSWLYDIVGLRRFNQNPKKANLLTSFATVPKGVAFDQYKNTNHSPYALSFLRELNNPNREIGDLFRSLRTRVKHLTQNQQSPVIYEERDARRILFYEEKRAKHSYLAVPPNIRGKVRYLNGVRLIDNGEIKSD